MALFLYTTSLQELREPTLEEFLRVTRLYAIGTEWEFISLELGIPIQELMTWPERYPEEWVRFVKDTEQQLFRQALSEGLAGARRLVHDENPRIALEATKALLNYAKTHELILLEELKAINRIEGTRRKITTEASRNAEKQRAGQDSPGHVGNTGNDSHPAGDPNPTLTNSVPVPESTQQVPSGTPSLDSTLQRPQPPSHDPSSRLPQTPSNMIVCSSDLLVITADPLPDRNSARPPIIAPTETSDRPWVNPASDRSSARKMNASVQLI